ncbi:MAG: hypothetical protein ABR549_08360 [Mycobacteriales bacterium]
MRLLDRLVDDAGLFPPTSLSMDKALARFRNTSSPLLTGRFLVPGSRLHELSSLLDGAIDVHVIGPGTSEDDRIRVLAREGMAVTETPCYVEGVAPSELPEGVFGKVRCAGVGDEELAAYLDEAVRVSRPFKATAGLHRAVRGWDGAGFHGYLNVLLAVARAIDGGKAIDAIVEDDPDVLTREARALSEDQATAVRWLFHSYGSCDTLQPTDDARELGLAV